jgi:hypothetical protein
MAAQRSSSNCLSFSPSRARGGELGEHDREQVLAARLQFLQRQGLGGEHARPAQRVGRGQLGGTGQQRPHFRSQGFELLQHLLVDPEGLARSRRSGKRDPAFDLAARDLRDQGLAQHRLDRAQVVGQPELDVEIAVVDRAHLEAQRPVRELARRRGVSRHAVYHCKTVNRKW